MSNLSALPSWHVVVLDLLPALPEYSAYAKALSKDIRESLTAARLANPSDGLPDFAELIRSGRYPANDEIAAIRQLRADIPQGRSFILGAIKPGPEGGRPIVELKYITFPDRTRPADPKTAPAGAVGVPLFAQVVGAAPGGQVAVEVLPTIQELRFDLIDDSETERAALGRRIVSELQVPASLRDEDLSVPAPPPTPVIVPAPPPPVAPPPVSAPPVAAGPTPVTWSYGRMALGAAVGVGVIAGGIWLGNKITKG